MSRTHSKLRGEAYIILENMKKVSVTFFFFFFFHVCWTVTLRQEHFLVN